MITLPGMIARQRCAGFSRSPEKACRTRDNYCVRRQRTCIVCLEAAFESAAMATDAILADRELTMQAVIYWANGLSLVRAQHLNADFDFDSI
jgi:hypothetical protein